MPGGDRSIRQLLCARMAHDGPSNCRGVGAPGGSSVPARAATDDQAEVPHRRESVDQPGASDDAGRVAAAGHRRRAVQEPPVARPPAWYAVIDVASTRSRSVRMLGLPRPLAHGSASRVRRGRCRVPVTVARADAAGLRASQALRSPPSSGAPRRPRAMVLLLDERLVVQNRPTRPGHGSRSPARADGATRSRRRPTTWPPNFWPSSRVDDDPPSARVHLADGLWVTLRAARIGDGSSIAVTIEETTAAERLDLFGRARSEHT